MLRLGGSIVRLEGNVGRVDSGLEIANLLRNEALESGCLGLVQAPTLPCFFITLGKLLTISVCASLFLIWKREVIA